MTLSFSTVLKPKTYMTNPKKCVFVLWVLFSTLFSPWQYIFPVVGRGARKLLVPQTHGPQNSDARLEGGGDGTSHRRMLFSIIRTTKIKFNINFFQSCNFKLFTIRFCKRVSILNNWYASNSLLWSMCANIRRTLPDSTGSFGRCPAPPYSLTKKQCNIETAMLRYHIVAWIGTNSYFCAVGGVQS